ncbi:Cupin domain protein [Pseudovibrio axinellae]|uniref:Cupin domain protein n=1 Tax=Pseudovibrio axinellae TaxID=989403 RepID=A0A166B046_9HYPH|nr:cupin domain-containing protein [Pseudovibrio axinellae]KZL21772.1 Cupin domain protein [Pseudovibrio axinellae]SEQ22694.1 Cupin domain-containing protein [Pseudovibrio axinellae]
MRSLIVAGACCLLMSGFPGAAAAQDSEKAYNAPEVLLDKSETTITKQPFYYPSEGKAQITSLIITLAPGEVVKEHKHPVPLYGYILDGELTITYEEEAPVTVKKGEALIEALNTWHYGQNTGTVPTRILAVFMGAKGVPNVIRPSE